jgi:hypothetical protein
MTTTASIPCKPRYNYPAPIAAWQSVIERLRSVAGGDGYKVIRFVVMVDGNGRPTHWLEPSVKRVEPKGRAEGSLAVLLDELGKA